MSIQNLKQNTFKSESPLKYYFRKIKQQIKTTLKLVRLQRLEIVQGKKKKLLNLGVIVNFFQH